MSKPPDAVVDISKPDFEQTSKIFTKLWVLGGIKSLEYINPFNTISTACWERKQTNR